MTFQKNTKMFTTQLSPFNLQIDLFETGRNEGAIRKKNKEDTRRH